MRFDSLFFFFFKEGGKKRDYDRLMELYNNTLKKYETINLLTLVVQSWIFQKNVEFAGGVHLSSTLGIVSSLPCISC